MASKMWKSCQKIGFKNLPSWLTNPKSLRIYFIIDNDLFLSSLWNILDMVVILLVLMNWKETDFNDDLFESVLARLWALTERSRNKSNLLIYHGSTSSS